MASFYRLRQARDDAPLALPTVGSAQYRLTKSRLATGRRKILLLDRSVTGRRRIGVLAGRRLVTGIRLRS
jgi:hypothetical protein